MHDPTLVANISLPEDLETIDLLRRAAMKSDDFDKQRKNSKAVSDCAFNVLSMEGSFTTFHQDKLGTFAVVSVGSKLWAFAPNTSKNLEARLSWTLSHGLGVFENCFVVDTLPGDLLLVPCGWHHAVYSPQDSLMHGGHYILAEGLVSNLEAATTQQKYRGLANESLAGVGEYFRILIKV